jgi:hypothetical protein
LQPYRDTKAELNRRSQACEVLTGTGVRVAENGPTEMQNEECEVQN